MKVAGSYIRLAMARAAFAAPASGAHGGAGQELARDSLLTGELLPGLAAGPDVSNRCLRSRTTSRPP